MQPLFTALRGSNMEQHQHLPLPSSPEIDYIAGVERVWHWEESEMYWLAVFHRGKPKPWQLSKQLINLIMPFLGWITRSLRIHMPKYPHLKKTSFNIRQKVVTLNSKKHCSLVLTFKCSSKQKKKNLSFAHGIFSKSLLKNRDKYLKVLS